MTDSARTGACLPLGEAGRNVIANVERIRKVRRLSFRQLADLLGCQGRPIAPTVLHRQSQGGRRVDADDLVAFAEIFGVTPADLLAPPGDARPPDSDHPALRDVRNLADRVGLLLAADGDTILAARQVGRALRRVQIEIEELLEQAEETRS